MSATKGASPWSFYSSNGSLKPEIESSIETHRISQINRGNQPADTGLSFDTKMIGGFMTSLDHSSSVDISSEPSSSDYFHWWYLKVVDKQQINTVLHQVMW